MSDVPIRSEATFTCGAADPTTLASALAGALEAGGCECDPPQDLGGPVRLLAKLGRRRFAILIGRLPDEVSWLLSVSSGVAPVMRMLGSDASTDQARLLDAVHAALVDRDDVGDLRWHTADDRANGRGDRATDSPTG